MGLRDEVIEMKKEVEAVKKESFAMELLKDMRKTNKRIFVILLVVLGMWFTTIVAFVYYINTTGYETITEEVNTDNGGNDCIGDSCNNGEISYGDSKKNN